MSNSVVTRWTTILGLLAGSGGTACGEPCELLLDTNRVYEITVLEYVRTLRSGCPMKVTAEAGDTFVVRPGRIVHGAGNCDGNTLEGDRPDFVPSEYGTCGAGSISALTCANRQAQSCTPFVEITLIGFDSSDGKGRMNLSSFQCSTGMQQGTCEDDYIVAIRPIQQLSGYTQ